MFTYFSANNTRTFVDVLDLFVDQYNDTIHSSIKMTPKEASRKENENKVWRNLYSKFGGKTLTLKCSIGDHVRITKKMKTFDRRYTQRWTEGVFIISSKQPTTSGKRKSCKRQPARQKAASRQPANEKRKGTRVQAAMCKRKRQSGKQHARASRRQTANGKREDSER